jgi:hypothetical protein
MDGVQYGMESKVRVNLNEIQNSVASGLLILHALFVAHGVRVTLVLPTTHTVL